MTINTYKTDAARLMANHVSPNYVGGFEYAVPDATFSVIYALTHSGEKFGRVQHHALREGRDCFDHKNADWVKVKFIPDYAQFIGNYKMPEGVEILLGA